jgi:Tfp pilus assembly protein PilN
MPSINMIAARRAEKSRLEQKTRNLVYGIAVEIGLFIVALSFMLVQVVTTQGQVGELNDKIVKLKPQVDKIQSLEQQTAHLQPKLTALNSARDNTLYWYTAIEDLTDSLSAATSLASLVSSGSPDPAAAKAAAPTPTAAAVPAQFVVSGVALSQTDVGQTMLHMNQYKQFDNVTLGFSQLSSVNAAASKGAQNAVQFQMTIVLHPLAQPAAAKSLPGAINVQKS